MSIDLRPLPETFAANVAALTAHDVTSAARIAAADPLVGFDLAATRAGVPTLSVDGVLLHNRHDPQAEAQQWANASVERLTADGAETAVVLGFGLGYHVEALRRRFTGRVVVVEPDAALLRTAFGCRDLRALWAQVELAPASLRDEDIDAWGRVSVLRHGPSWLRPETLLRALAERIAARSTARQTRLSVMVISPLNGGSYPITGYCARALASLGHDVHVLDLAPFASGAEALPSFGTGTIARRHIQQAFGTFLSAGIRTAVEQLQPDVVLAMAQAPLDAALLQQLGALGCVRAFWFVEDHRLFPYWRDVIGSYDYFGVIQQGAFFDDAVARCPGKVLYLPLAADPSVHRPLVLTPEEQEEFGSPVSFVGAGYRNRQVAFRPLLDDGLKIWGSDWGNAGALLPAVQRQGARISTEDSVRIFNASTINLNLHSSTYVDGVEPRGDFVNPRTFELAACGAFQLVDRRALLAPLFTAGKELITFDDAGDLRDLVRAWQERPEDRARVTAAARARVLTEHTYAHRMMTLLETICVRESERFQRKARPVTTHTIAARASTSPLGSFLATLPPQTPFSLDGVVGALRDREGDLEDPENIFLFLHQFDDLYVKEHRS